MNDEEDEQEVEMHTVLNKFATVCGYDESWLSKDGDIMFGRFDDGQLSTPLFIDSIEIDPLDGSKHEVLKADDFIDAVHKLMNALLCEEKTVTVLSSNQPYGLLPTKHMSFDNKTDAVTEIVFDCMIHGLYAYRHTERNREEK